MNKKVVILFAILLMLLTIESNHGKRVEMDAPLRMGEYATGSSGYLDEEELKWLSKFEMVHAGSIEEPILPEDIAYLKEKGVKTILADDWLPAAYYYPDGSNNPFMEWVYENRYDVTLNPDGPFPHCQENGYDWEEYYFDFANPVLIEHRVAYIVNGLKKAGYDGIFFDWGNSLFLQEDGYESINATYNSRHPNTPYSRAAADFLASLRNAMEGIIIENNQGFREANYYFPVLDYDMAESYLTGCDYYGKKLYVKGSGFIEVPQTIYYPVSQNEFEGEINDTIHYLDYLADLREEYGGNNFKRTVYMNYAAPDFVFAGKENGHDAYEPAVPKNAIYFGYALAKLAGQISYTEVPWNHTYERCNVYFYDIGKPLGNDYEKIDGGYVRYYSNGFVIAGEWQKEKRIELTSPYIPSNTALYDAFEEKWLTTGKNNVSIIIKPCPDDLTGRMAPSGRIFVYAPRLYARITKPKNMLYIMDREIMQVPFDKPIIIGAITIKAETNGKSVEFYIDDELKYNDSIPPYQWQWNEFAMGWHEIKVIAYDNSGDEAQDREKIWIFNI